MERFLTWLPRVITIAYILFISIFAADALTSDGSVFEKIGRLVAHLIPSALAAGLLFVAWRVRILGGLLFLVFGLALTIYFQTYRSTQNFLMISFPLMLAGVLFIFSHWHAGKSSVG